VARPERRRLYLMRHGQVSYFGADGRPVRPQEVVLTPAGEEQAQAAAAALAGIELDRAITSGLPRTLATARIVAPQLEPEVWPELREIESGRLADLPPDGVEAAFLECFRGVVPEERAFLGGETIGSLLDRVLPALDRLVADESWHTALAVLHGAVNRAVLSRALAGRRVMFGNIEQASGCINVLDLDEDWIVRAINVTPYDLVHRAGRATTMEELYEQYRPFRAS
jgi:probable phosphoglycerate mutase